MKQIKAKGIDIHTFQQSEHDYISLTDIARYKNALEPKTVVGNWMRNHATIEFLGIWEQINNPNFKGLEFEAFKKEAGANSFTLSPSLWVEKTSAIGIISKVGRFGGGTFAHKDIAFEFATWVSAEFKLYLIKEFQRLKVDETERLALGWDAKRALTKINYRIHTDSIRDEIVLPQKLSKREASAVYANEADVLNVALYGITASDWKKKNKGKSGNMRDYSDVYQLICLANLETLNAEFIKMGMTQKDRLVRLNDTAISQMRSLLVSPVAKKLLK